MNKGCYVYTSFLARAARCTYVWKKKRTDWKKVLRILTYPRVVLSKETPSSVKKIYYDIQRLKEYPCCFWGGQLLLSLSLWRDTGTVLDVDGRRYLFNVWIKYTQTIVPRLRSSTYALSACSYERFLTLHEGAQEYHADDGPVIAGRVQFSRTESGIVQRRWCHGRFSHTRRDHSSLTPILFEFSSCCLGSLTSSTADIIKKTGNNKRET